MDSRQQFEAYILKRNAGDIDYWKDKGGLTGMIGSDLYNVAWVQNDYELWMASRESVVVDLPKQFKEADCPDLEELHEAIHSAGIRTK